MTLLATLAIFTAALSTVWLATQRAGRQHECSCSRSRRVLADYERIHRLSSKPRRQAIIPPSELARKPGNRA